jgi:hypothetical protein
VVIHHSFGIARGARGVIERDRLPFVARQFPGETRVALRQKLLVRQLAQQFAALRILVVDVNNQRLVANSIERLRNHARILAVCDERLAIAMLEDESDRLGVQPDVERIEHRARHGHAEMCLQQLGYVRRHYANRVAHADAAPLQGCRQPNAPLEGFAPTAPDGAMNHRCAPRKHCGRTPDERQRRQRRVIRVVLVQCDFV